MQDKSTKKRNNRSLLIGVAALVGVLIIGRLVSGPADPPPPLPEATATVASTATPRPRATAAEAATALSPYAALVTGIDAALGESNREMNSGRKFTGLDYRADEGSVSVTWAADDHFSNSLILAGIERDATAVLRAIDESGAPYEAVFLAATFAVQDAAGNASESEVVVASFDRAAVERAARAGFSAADVLDIAGSSRVSPVLRDE